MWPEFWPIFRLRNEVVLLYMFVNIKTCFMDILYYVHMLTLIAQKNYQPSGCHWTLVWKPLVTNRKGLNLKTFCISNFFNSLSVLLRLSEFPQGPLSISPPLSAPNWSSQGASDVTYTQIINWFTKRFPLTSCSVCEAPLHALVPRVKGPPCQSDEFLCLFVCTHAPVAYSGHCRTWISYFVVGAFTCSNANKGNKRFGRSPVACW